MIKKSTRAVLKPAAGKPIERVIYQNGDDLAIAVSCAFERLAEQLAAAEGRLFGRLSKIETELKSELFTGGSRSKAAANSSSAKSSKEIKMVNVDGSVTTCNHLEMLALETHGQGEIECAYSQLVSQFGKPSEGDGYKTQAEWLVYTPTGVATIYDWKQGDCYHGNGKGTPVEQVTEWSIGGHNKSVVEWINKAVKISK